jgi:hypothetical protein
LGDVVIQVLGSEPRGPRRRIDEAVEELSRRGFADKPDVLGRVAGDREVDHAQRFTNVGLEFGLGDARFLEVDDVPEFVTEILLPCGMGETQ